MSDTFSVIIDEPRAIAMRDFDDEAAYGSLFYIGLLLCGLTTWFFDDWFDAFVMPFAAINVAWLAMFIRRWKTQRRRTRHLRNGSRSDSRRMCFAVRKDGFVTVWDDDVWSYGISLQYHLLSATVTDSTLELTFPNAVVVIRKKHVPEQKIHQVQRLLKDLVDAKILNS